MSKNKNGNLIAEGMADFLDRNQKLSLPKPQLEKKASKESDLKNVFDSLVSAASALNELGFVKSSVYTMNAIEHLLAQAKYTYEEDESEDENGGDEDLFDKGDRIDLDPDSFSEVESDDETRGITDYELDSDAIESDHRRLKEPGEVDLDEEENEDLLSFLNEHEKPESFEEDEDEGNEDLYEPYEPEYDFDDEGNINRDKEEEFWDADDGETKPKKSHKKKLKIDDDITARPTGGSERGLFQRELEPPGFISHKTRDLDPEDENWFLE